MKKWLIKFFISRGGSILTPIIAGIVAAGVAKLAEFSPEVAGQVNQGEVTMFLWGLILAAVNLWTNQVQTDGVKRLQGALEVTPDGWAGPKTYVEVRKATAHD
jgi:Zn-dependent protease with chaperone function